MKERQLTPRIAQTAKGLWYVYVSLTVLCVIGSFRDERAICFSLYSDLARA